MATLAVLLLTEVEGWLVNFFEGLGLTFGVARVDEEFLNVFF